MTLLDRYDDYSKRRAIQSDLEDDGEADPDLWEALEDEADALLSEFAPAYEGLLRAASNVIASLAAAVRDLQQVAMLDTASSASRQHWIDTGRFLQEGEQS